MNQIVGTSYFYLRQLFGTKVKIPEEFVSHLPVVELPVEIDNDTDNQLGPVYESQSVGNVILNDGDKTIALLDVAEQRTDYNTLRQQPKPVIASNLEKTPLLLSINPRGLPVNPELIQLRNKTNQVLRGGRNADATLIIELINQAEEMIPQSEEEQTIVNELKETLETATAIALGDTDVLQEKLENIETQPPDLPEASFGLPEAPVQIPSVEPDNFFNFFNFGQSSVPGETKIDTNVAEADAKAQAEKEAADAKAKAEKEAAEAREKVEKEAADAKAKAEKEAAEAKAKAEKETAEAVTASYIKAAADKVKANQLNDEAEKQAELQRIEKEKEEVKKQAELKEKQKKEKADKELKSALKIIQAFNQQKLKKLAVAQLNKLKEEAKQKSIEEAEQKTIEEAKQKAIEEAKQKAIEEQATIRKTIQEQTEITDEDVRKFFDAIDIFDELNKDDIMKNHLNILKTIFQEAKETYKKEEQKDTDSVYDLIGLYKTLKGITFKAFLKASLQNKLKLFNVRERRKRREDDTETTEEESQPTRGQRTKSKYNSDTDEDISNFFDSLNEQMGKTFYETLDITERPNATIARNWYLKIKNMVKKNMVKKANETNETELTPEEGEQLWKTNGIQYIIDKIYTNLDPSDKQSKIDIIRKKYEESVKESLFERKLLSSSGKREPPSGLNPQNDELTVETLEPEKSAKSEPVKDNSTGMVRDPFSVNYFASEYLTKAEENKTRQTSKFPTFEKLYQSQQRYFTDADTNRYEVIWDKIRGNTELNQPGISLSSSFKVEDIANKIKIDYFGNDGKRLRDLIKANSEYNKTINAQTSKYKDTPKFTPSSGNRDMSYPKPGTLQQVLKREKEQEKEFLTQEQYDYNTKERKKIYVNTMNEYKRLYKDNILVLYPLIRGIHGYRQFDKLGSIDKVAILVAYKELLQKYSQKEIRYTYTNSLNQQKEIRKSKAEELQEIEQMIQKIKTEHPEINWKDITEQ